MKITFPHLGNTYISVKSLLDDLGVEYIIPPFNNKKALELGTRLVPEMVCLPLKINIGNYIQAYGSGADTIIMAGGCGPCRFGYYCELQQEILHDAGYDMEMITFDLTKGNVRKLIDQLRRVPVKARPYEIPAIAARALRIVKKVDELEMLSFKLRVREEESGSVSGIYNSFRTKVLDTVGTKAVLDLLDETEAKLGQIRLNRIKRPLRIGIVGEIYTGIEQFASFNIQERLGTMGIEVDRKVTVSNWVFDHIIKKHLHMPRDNSCEIAAKPWLGTMIGGHAQETVGNTVLYARNNYDGVIQIFPFSCMPEIVAESLLPSIERELGIPVLTLIIDEMTGEAGYMTRVEAFADMLEKRRESGKNEGGWELSWN
ncbi:MAG: CoA protein activase [Clostridiaceae bacterium]